MGYVKRLGFTDMTTAGEFKAASTISNNIFACSEGTAAIRLDKPGTYLLVFNFAGNEHKHASIYGRAYADTAYSKLRTITCSYGGNIVLPIIFTEESLKYYIKCAIDSVSASGTLAGSLDIIYLGNYYA